MIKAEAVEGEEPSERFRGQVVQGVVAKTKPLYIVQALAQIADQFQSIGFLIFVHNHRYLKRV